MYVTVDEKITNLPNGKKLRRIHTRGVVVTRNDEPTRSTTCWGSRVLNADGSYNSGAGFCHEVDPDGGSHLVTLTFGGLSGGL